VKTPLGTESLISKVNAIGGWEEEVAGDREGKN